MVHEKSTTVHNKEVLGEIKGVSTQKNLSVAEMAPQERKKAKSGWPRKGQCYLWYECNGICLIYHCFFICCGSVKY